MRGDFKASLWNSYIQIDDTCVLVFNAKTDNFVVVNKQQYLDQIKQGKTDGLPSDICEKLLEYSFLVPKDIDEASELEQTIYKVDEDNEIFNLIINPTLQCNFRCWYCYEEHKSLSYMSENTIRSISKFVENTIKKNSELKFLNLSFFGGEPLLEFKRVVVPILQQLDLICKENDVHLSVHFTTNGSLLTKDIMLFLKNYDAGFQITLDGGAEFHNKTRYFVSGKPSFDIILNNIKELAQMGMKVVLRINYTLANLQSVLDIVQYLEKIEMPYRNNINVDFQAVWQEAGNLASNTEYKTLLFQLKKKFKELGYLVSHQATNNYVLNSCYADKRNEALVNYSGDIYSCTARDFTPESRMGVLLEDGNISWENNSLETKMNCKFKKSICRTCRIAPICGGGCRTKCLENSHHEGCNLNMSEEQIDDLILERFEVNYMSDNTLK